MSNVIILHAGRGEVLVLLLESGIDPNCCDEQTGMNSIITTH